MTEDCTAPDTFTVDGAISVVLLDADGVFQRTPPAVWEEIKAFTTRDDKVGFRNAILEVERGCVYEGADFEKELAIVLREWQGAGTVDDFLRLWYTIEVDGDLLELVSELRSLEVLCCTASNQLRGRAHHMSEILGLRGYFDREFYPYALGALKPDSKFFLGFVHELGVPPSHVLLVDDRSQNVAAAQAIGMQAHLFPDFGGVDALRAALVTRDLVAFTGAQRPQ